MCGVYSISLSMSLCTDIQNSLNFPHIHEKVHFQWHPDSKLNKKIWSIKRLEDRLDNVKFDDYDLSVTLSSHVCSNHHYSVSRAIDYP